MVGTNCGQNFFESSYGEKPAVSNGYRLCRWAIVIHCDDALGSVNNGFSHRRIVVGRTTSELMDGSGHLRFRSASTLLPTLNKPFGAVAKFSFCVPSSEMMENWRTRSRSPSSVLSCRICPTTPVGKKRRRVRVVLVWWAVSSKNSPNRNRQKIYTVRLYLLAGEVLLSSRAMNGGYFQPSMA